MGTLLTVVILALIGVVAVAVIPALLNQRKDRDRRPTTRSHLEGAQEEKIADQARPSKQK